MTTNKPLWLQAVQTVDRIAAPVLEGAANHEGFAISVSLLQQTRRAVYRRTERLSRHILHGLNLPTASDVNRLLTQIAAVENRVRLLANEIEGLPSGHAAPRTADTPSTVRAKASRSARGPQASGAARSSSGKTR